MSLLQTIFNNAYLGIIKQNAFCYDYRESVCFYRHNSMACAIGWSIDDAYYSKRLEGKGVYDDDILLALSESLDVPQEDIRLLSVPLDKLQMIHDYAAPRKTIDEFKIKMEEYAQLNHLTVPPIPESQLVLDLYKETTHGQ